MERLADAYDHLQDEPRDTPSLPSLESFAFDVFAIAAVAVVLALVMETLPSFRDQFVLHYDDPTALALYTTHFVHGSTTHLQSNLYAYLAVVPLLYVICLEADRHREFRIAFLVTLFVLPPLISLVSLFGLDIAYASLFGGNPNVQTSRGFSALDGAFVGLLIVAVADLLRSASGRDASLWPVVGVLFCIGLAGGFWHVFAYTASVYAVLLVLVPVVYAAWLLRRVEEAYGVGEGLRAGGWLRGRPVAICLLWLGSVMAVWGVQSLLAFPPFEGGTNTLSHFVGVVAGIGALVVLAGSNCSNSSRF